MLPDSHFSLAEIFVLGHTQQGQAPAELVPPARSRAASKKVKWTEQEDATLTKNIEQFGTSNWSLIASSLPGRSGKQCRERWTNQLDPMLNRDNWTPQEDALLLYNQQLYGNCWSKIMQFLPRRSSNSVKNRWCWLTRHRTHPPRVSQLLPYLSLKQAIPVATTPPAAPVKSALPEVEIKMGGEQAMPTLVPDVAIQDFCDTVFNPHLLTSDLFGAGQVDQIDLSVNPIDTLEPFRFYFEE